MSHLISLDFISGATKSLAFQEAPSKHPIFDRCGYDSDAVLLCAVHGLHGGGKSGYDHFYLLLECYTSSIQVLLRLKPVYEELTVIST